MKVSVVVPAFNEEKLLGDTLASIQSALSAFTTDGWESEIIVCDNNSTDRTAAIATEAGARVVHEPHNQIARARNSGAAAATGEWLIFVDADSNPCTELFASVKAVIDGGDCIGGGCTLRMNESWWTSWMIHGWNLASRALRWPAGSFIFCEKAAFDALGGFSLKLYASEEIEFAGRLKRLARKQRRKVRILSAHPMRTSPRKIRLYTFWELFRFAFKFCFFLGNSRFSRNSCHPWYDGRR